MRNVRTTHYEFKVNLKTIFKVQETLINGIEVFQVCNVNYNKLTPTFVLVNFNNRIPRQKAQILHLFHFFLIQ